MTRPAELDDVDRHARPWGHMIEPTVPPPEPSVAVPPPPFPWRRLVVRTLLALGAFVALVYAGAAVWSD